MGLVCTIDGVYYFYYPIFIATLRRLRLAHCKLKACCVSSAIGCVHLHTVRHLCITHAALAAAFIAHYNEEDCTQQGSPFFVALGRGRLQASAEPMGPHPPLQ